MQLACEDENGEKHGGSMQRLIASLVPSFSSEWSTWLIAGKPERKGRLGAYWVAPLEFVGCWGKRWTVGSVVEGGERARQRARHCPAK